MKRNQGLTLVETMTTLFIASIVVAVAIPSFSYSHQYFRTESHLSKVEQLLYFARNQAVTYGVPVTACPLNKSNRCENNWQSGFTIFTDLNRNSQFDSDEDTIIKTAPAVHGDDYMTYSRKHIRFIPSGTADGTQGSIKYCPDSKESELRKALVISTGGRMRIEENNVADCNISALREPETTQITKI